MPDMVATVATFTSAASLAQPQRDVISE